MKMAIMASHCLSEVVMKMAIMASHCLSEAVITDNYDWHVRYYSL